MSPAPSDARNAFNEGRSAAAKDIPADANPYAKGSDAHAQWMEGHEAVAGGVEASESEG